MDRVVVILCTCIQAQVREEWARAKKKKLSHYGSVLGGSGLQVGE